MFDSERHDELTADNFAKTLAGTLTPDSQPPITCTVGADRLNSTDREDAATLTFSFTAGT